MVDREEVRVVPSPRVKLPAPGTVFAGHVVEAMVGRGGMGVVFRARHRVLDRVVALKLIAPELSLDASTHHRLLEEAATAAYIEHPNVVPVHDAGVSEGVAYMIMRYVRGTDLHTMVRERGLLEPAHAAEIVAQVGDALDTLHAAGFVHRDVKPRNVLVSSDHHVYLSDFGLARQVAHGACATDTGHWAGTVDYVAPEQICGARTDARTDVYGLGGLLYFVLTGRRPYERDDDGAKLWAHMYAAPPSVSQRRPSLPDELDAVIARALAKDPDERYQSAGELGRAALAATRAGRCQRTVAPSAPAPCSRNRKAGLPEAPTVSSAGASRGSRVQWRGDAMSAG